MFQKDNLQILCTSLKEVVEIRGKHATDTDVKITAVKSMLVSSDIYHISEK